MIGFNMLVRDMPKDMSVLDVGAWGLTGENTTTYLTNHFKTVITMNIKPIHGVDIVGDFYTNPPNLRFDLIVLDLNIDNNLSHDWTREGMNRIHKMLNPGGFVILYLLTKEGYTNDEPAKTLINNSLNHLWKSSPVTVDGIGNAIMGFKDIFDLVAIQPDDRRDNIAWVKLQRYDGPKN